MSKTTPPAGFLGPKFGHQWYLREWMAERGKRQVDLIKELGWSSGKANEVFKGQQYTQALIDVLAPWLDVEHYELLMPPALAVSLRRLKASAATIVAEAGQQFTENGLEDIRPPARGSGRG